jgi:LmbE family N-acetylglucosaminyl deacetylase
VKLSHPRAAVFVPDAVAEAAALARTTHLGVGAHADDLEIMAIHGILECFEQPSRWFSGVIVTDGAGSPSRRASTDGESLVVRRRQEQERAAVLGKYGAVVFLDHPSTVAKATAERAVIDDLVAVLRATRPRIVYTHALTDAHETHVAVALRLVAACRELQPAERPERVLGCEVWRGLDWLTPPHRVELAVDARPELQRELLEVFTSQVSEKRYDRATLGRRSANAVFTDSHLSDRHEAVTLAMDLTPLMAEVGQSESLVQSFVRSLEKDLLARIGRLTR